MVLGVRQGDAGRMTRFPRFDLPGVPQHIVQRGNNRLPCFLDDADRQRYLQCLRQALVRFRCRLHAYVLMSNHVHLLLTPTEQGAVSRMMHTFSRNYVGLFNGRHGRTGTLWRDATRRVWSTPGVIFWHAAATSSSTQCGRGWSGIRRSIRGPAMCPTPASGSIPC
jgi:REP element-mobilizing transposase RayT